MVFLFFLKGIGDFGVTWDVKISVPLLGSALWLRISLLMIANNRLAAISIFLKCVFVCVYARVLYCELIKSARQKGFDLMRCAETTRFLPRRG